MIFVISIDKVLHDTSALEDSYLFTIGKGVRDGCIIVSVREMDVSQKSCIQGNLPGMRPFGLISRNHGSFGTKVVHQLRFSNKGVYG